LSTIHATSWHHLLPTIFEEAKLGKTDKLIDLATNLIAEQNTSRETQAVLCKAILYTKQPKFAHALYNLLSRNQAIDFENQQASLPLRAPSPELANSHTIERLLNMLETVQGSYQPLIAKKLITVTENASAINFNDLAHITTDTQVGQEEYPDQKQLLQERKEHLLELSTYLENFHGYRLHPRDIQRLKQEAPSNKLLEPIETEMASFKQQLFLKTLSKIENELPEELNALISPEQRKDFRTTSLSLSEIEIIEWHLKDLSIQTDEIIYEREEQEKAHQRTIIGAKLQKAVEQHPDVEAFSILLNMLRYHSEPSIIEKDMQTKLGEIKAKEQAQIAEDARQAAEPTRAIEAGAPADETHKKRTRTERLQEESDHLRRQAPRRKRSKGRLQTVGKKPE